MISVCIATYNGEKYIKELLSSILYQIDCDDEIIISDDCSTDNTVDLVLSFSDKRIKIYQHEKKLQHFNIDYATKNFENALKHANGDLIFLADQDDIWLPDKVTIMSKWLKKHELVISDCRVVDEHLQTLYESYFLLMNTKNGLLNNFIKNKTLGCCMAFKKQILVKVLPFPESGVGHDLWIYFLSHMFFSVKLVHEPLVLYRRHNNNVTPSSARSSYSLRFKLYYRFLIIKALLMRVLFDK